MAMTSHLHALLLLSDSALPLGSFAFSSGLESFLAHKSLSGLHSAPTTTKLSAFDLFLSQSITNISSTSLPYVLDAYHHPEKFPELDNDMDASTPCTVARRASIAQGRALVGVWERALASAANLQSPAAIDMADFCARLKTNTSDIYGLRLEAHFAPLFGVVCAALGLEAKETAYLFLLNHAKAVLSAAVRASVMGPYQSQSVLASATLQSHINACVGEMMGKDGGKGVRHEEAIVSVPTMDLWMGRHELLYSRIFNS